MNGKITAETLSALSTPYLEALHEAYQQDPASVEPEWREFFASEHGDSESPRLGPSFDQGSVFRPASARGNGSNGHSSNGKSQAVSALAPESMQERVDTLIRAYRTYGHLKADIDPLGLREPIDEELRLDKHCLTQANLDQPFTTRVMESLHSQQLTLRQIIEAMEYAYCGPVGVQYMHIDESDNRKWLHEELEKLPKDRYAMTRDQKFQVLKRLTHAAAFEGFARKRFPGKKTFSLEGGEALIPLLDLAIETAAHEGQREIVIAMAHRGRLNVLANIMRKSPSLIFKEMKGGDPSENVGRGDVAFHLGYSHDVEYGDGKKIHLSLCFNPSHLEYVNPVGQGRIRAKQDRQGDTERRQGMLIQIHGDAAFIGEGVVQETLNMSRLDGYHTGGSLHIIVNNQIGFTTEHKQGRSSRYSSGVGQMLNIPIFHVNGEDPVALFRAVDLAMRYRREFQRDVIIDIYCYRRLGHNEMDEARMTNPVLYNRIDSRYKNGGDRTESPVLDAFIDKVEADGITRDQADGLWKEHYDYLEGELEKTENDQAADDDGMKPRRGVWKDYLGGSDESLEDVDTGAPREQLVQTLEAFIKVPKGFQVHRTLKRSFIGGREKIIAGEQDVDWASGEALALGTLLLDGHSVRLSGQDSQRGTFTQRHLVYHDQNNGKTYEPLKALESEKVSATVLNSPLSENGPLGFEYGYSLDTPEALVCWEGQFGDFANAAQVIIDQFIASAEDKWQRLSGLVMLLPHGFEGQGPEHSSARMERFLLLAAEDNLQITYPSTPAQYFHLLRRQIHRKWRKPLIVMTPKSLLRHKLCVSPLEKFTKGRFERIIPDPGGAPKKVKRVLMCSGKVYYDLFEKREALGLESDVHIVRLEQFYPLQVERVREILSRYKKKVPVYWVQEEPENMGARWYITNRIAAALENPFEYVHRPASASPATGSKPAHENEQAEILQKAFDGV